MFEKGIILKILGIAAFIAIALSLISGCQGSTTKTSQEQIAPAPGSTVEQKLVGPRVLFFTSNT